MKITRQSPQAEGTAFTAESIQAVRDFTARKTLEQALAVVTGLRRVLAGEGADEADVALAAEISRLGIGMADVEQMAAEAVALIDRMADRDAKAEVFHAAVKEAGQRERDMYEKLATLARTLRAELSGHGGALGKLGVPPLGADLQKTRPKPPGKPGKAIFSAVAGK